MTALIYEFTTEFPRQEIYGLTSQMRRAAVSIASNIAEGSARGTRKNFKQFVKQAEGSNCELQTQLTSQDVSASATRQNSLPLRLSPLRSERCSVDLLPTSHEKFNKIGPSPNYDN